VGRGGAGNFYDSATAASNQQEKAEAEQINTAVNASLSRDRAGLVGRGGLGNWRDNTTAATQDQESQRKKKEKLEAKILQDVEARLAMPQPTYRQRDRDAEGPLLDS
jgi:hypothetical protein